MKDNQFKRFISSIVIIAFVSVGVMPPKRSYASTPLSTSAQTTLNLPAVGTMVGLSPSYVPAMLRGVIIHPDNPFQFDFILDSGDSTLEGEKLKEESTRLIRYFLASLTMPEDDLWVNLSPYEKDRIIPDLFGQTEMGRDLLAQDYLLKQLAASLMYPEDELGQEFWDEVYDKAYEKYGTTNIPINTFNKVWIVPEKAVVYENGDRAFVVESKLKVMLEEEYLAMEYNSVGAAPRDRPNTNGQSQGVTPTNLATNVIREIILPAIKKEVNEGKNFAQLRQIYSSFILASWYKKNLKNGLLNQNYVDQKKIAGIEIEDKDVKLKIYNQYLETFKTGVYNYIKEEYDPDTKQIVPKKYFSGGIEVSSSVMIKSKQFSYETYGKTYRILSNLSQTSISSSPASKNEHGDTPSNSPDIYTSTIFPEFLSVVKASEAKVPIFIISGLPGSGKTSLAERLKKYFDDENYESNIIKSDGFYKHAERMSFYDALKAIFTTGFLGKSKNDIIQYLSTDLFYRDKIEELNHALHDYLDSPEKERVIPFNIDIDGKKGELELKTGSILIIEGLFSEIFFESLPITKSIFIEKDTLLARKSFARREHLKKEKSKPRWFANTEAYFAVSNKIGRVINSVKNKFDYILNLNDHSKPELRKTNSSSTSTGKQDIKSSSPISVIPKEAKASHVLGMAGGAKLLTSRRYQASRNIPNLARIVFNKRGDLLVDRRTWGRFKTTFSTIDDRMDIWKRILDLHAKRKDSSKPIVILDWGAGNGKALRQLSEKLRDEGIHNIRLIGYADIYYKEWEALPSNITMIWDLAENLFLHLQTLDIKQLDLIYSHVGMIHQKRLAEERFFLHLKRLAISLSSEGILVATGNQFAEGEDIDVKYHEAGVIVKQQLSPNSDPKHEKYNPNHPNRRIVTPRDQRKDEQQDDLSYFIFKKDPEIQTPVYMTDKYYRLAIHLARKSKGKNERYGSLLVKDGKIIGSGYNRAIVHPSFRLERPIRQGYVNHAEIEAVNDALMKGHDVTGADVYVAGYFPQTGTLFLKEVFTCTKCIPHLKKVGIRNIYVSAEDGWRAKTLDQALQEAGEFVQGTHAKRVDINRGYATINMLDQIPFDDNILTMLDEAASPLIDGRELFEGSFKDVIHNLTEEQVLKVEAFYFLQKLQEMGYPEWRDKDLKDIIENLIIKEVDSSDFLYPKGANVGIINAGNEGMEAAAYWASRERVKGVNFFILSLHDSLTFGKTHKDKVFAKTGIFLDKDGKVVLAKFKKPIVMHTLVHSGMYDSAARTKIYEAGVPLLNSPESIAKSQDKIWFNNFLEIQGLPIPEYEVLEGELSREEIHRKIRFFNIDNLIHDFVVKPSDLFQGKGVKMFNSSQISEAVKHTSRLLKQGNKVILQERIMNSHWSIPLKGGEYDYVLRVIPAWDGQKIILDANMIEVRFQPRNNDPINIAREAVGISLKKLLEFNGLSAEEIKEFLIPIKDIVVKAQKAFETEIATDKDGISKATGFMGWDLIADDDGHWHILEAGGGSTGGISLLEGAATDELKGQAVLPFVRYMARIAKVYQKENQELETDQEGKIINLLDEEILITNFGYAFFLSGDYRVAAVLFQEAQKYNPFNTNQMSLLADSLFRLKQFEKVAKLTKKILEEDSYRLYEWILLLRTLNELEVRSENEQYLAKAIEQNWDNKKWLVRLGIELKKYKIVSDQRIQIFSYLLQDESIETAVEFLTRLDDQKTATQLFSTDVFVDAANTVHLRKLTRLTFDEVR